MSLTLGTNNQPILKVSSITTQGQEVQKEISSSSSALMINPIVAFLQG